MPTAKDLAALSDDDLLSGLLGVIFDTRKLLVKLLFFLAEIERRRLHEDLGHKSLHDFCMRRYGMSLAAAHRRVTTLRLALRFPLIFELLESGALNMSTVLDLKSYLNEANHRELLNEAIGKSAEQIQELIAERFPRPDVPSSIRPAVLLPGDWLPPNEDGGAVCGHQGPPAYNERNILEVLSPDRHRVEFTASESLRRKLEHARSMMRHSNPKGDLGVIVERAMDLLIPRLERERYGKTLKPRKPGAPMPIANGDDIPPAIRHAVAERDGYQCVFCGEDGHRCGSRDWLEFDHIVPKALGGETTVENLRLLCRTHNRRAAEKAFGEQHVAKRIKDRQAKREADEATRALFAQVEGALVGMGFKKKEAEEAVVTVATEIEASERTLQTMVTKSVAFLTPSPSQRAARAAAAAPAEDTSAMVKRAEDGLAKMGFKRTAVIAALAKLAERVEASPISLEDLVKEALALLTRPATIMKPLPVPPTATVATPHPATKTVEDEDAVPDPPVGMPGATYGTLNPSQSPPSP